MRKGQSITLEQMFFFTIGIVILMSVFFSYNSIKDRITEVGVEDQLNEVGEMTLSSISKVANQLEFSDNYTITVDMPRQIADNNYIVAIVNNQLKVESFDGKTVLMSLESIDTRYIVRGSALSSLGGMRIAGDSSEETITISRYERI